MKLLEETIWKSFKRCDYEYNGHLVTIVLPRSDKIEGWIWRTEFFGAFSYADEAMVAAGYILTYYNISDLFGAPCAVELMRDFHKEFTSDFNILYKPILFGFSRGGLYALNYAAQYPCDIYALYLDAPVVDIKSWPGGMQSGSGDKNEWQKCIAAYEYKDENTAMHYEYIGKIDAICKAEIPVIMVAGDSDKVVPYKENGLLIEKRYTQSSGKIKVIIKEGVGHHPHSLEDPTPIVRFLRSI